jgi:hypothetical protein
MTQENQVFIAVVVVIDSTWETVPSNVISWPRGAVAKFSTIVKIRKYKRFQEGHHFILMAMEVHNLPKHDMDCFIRESVHLSIIDNQKVIYPCFFVFNF